MNGDTDKKRLTFDEAAALIEDVARNGEGAQKLRALAMVMANEASTVTLPEPLSVEEVVDRLARIMRAAGPSNSQFAYRVAFKNNRRDIQSIMPKVDTTDVPSFYKATLPKSLKQLYRQFPETKRSGVPAGYPSRGGLEMQTLWCQQKSLEILKAREEVRLRDLSPDALLKHVEEPDAR